MRQKVTFTADLYIEADGFDWATAAEAVRLSLVYGTRHQGYDLTLVDEEEG